MFSPTPRLVFLAQGIITQATILTVDKRAGMLLWGDEMQGFDEGDGWVRFALNALSSTQPTPPSPAFPKVEVTVWPSSLMYWSKMVA